VRCLKRGNVPLRYDDVVQVMRGYIDEICEPKWFTREADNMKEAATGGGLLESNLTAILEAASVKHGVTGASVVATAIPATSGSPAAPG
jgi:hypothetical protein